MKNNLLSKYVFTYAYDNNQTILYNSMNSSVVLLENKYFDNNFKNLSIEHRDKLENMGFLLEDSIADKQIVELYNDFKSEVLSIIIELTQNCNLQCVYCYQTNWNKEDALSLDSIDKTISYIKNCIIEEKYKNLEISFIGGEPLVAKDRMLLIYQKLKQLCKELNVKLEVAIDTNGVLLSKELIEAFDNLYLSVSLTMPKDHDKKRITKNNKGTYEVIIKNLIECKELFNLNDNYKLAIRYNTDYENKDFFSHLLDILINAGLKFRANTAYTFEHDYNSYKNTWSFNKYRIWNSSEVIDILISKGLQVTHKPNLLRTPCTAYYKYNLKIFSDGYLGLCNGYFPEQKKYRIDDIYNNINLVQELFPEKGKKPFDNINCRSCKEVLLCGGMHFCKQKPCEYGFVDLETYLKTYVNHVLNGESHFFTSFNVY